HTHACRRDRRKPSGRGRERFRGSDRWVDAHDVRRVAGGSTMNANEQLSVDAAGLPMRSVVRARPHRRGWVVRRVLAASDILTLVVAFTFTEIVFAGKTPAIDKVGPTEEIIIFGATLPLWIVAAKLYGLYDQDEERASHSTTDEFVSVFHLVTVAVVVFYSFSCISGL